MCMRSIKIVSYNIKLSKNSDKAVKLIKSNSNLREADVYCLQEMTEKAVADIAAKLQYNYVFYLTKRRHNCRIEIGNAVLSQHPIIDDCHIKLPSFKQNTLFRNAVGATIVIDGVKIMVFSVHKEVFLKTAHRKTQVKMITNAIASSIPHAIIAGDFNTFTKKNLKAVLETFEEAGFDLASSNIAWTYKHWYFINKKSRLDHIFTKGLDTIQAGHIVNRQPSDHLPIWAELVTQ